jgi:hypothetical protein
MGEALEMFNVYRVPVHHVSSLLLAAAIWRWGAGPERWLISVFIITMVAPVLIANWLGFSVAQTGPYAPVYAGLDVVAAVLFIAVALNANRIYPLWIAGFQLVAVATHVVRAVIDNVSELAYAVLVIGPSYCQLLLLFGGFVWHCSRSRRSGPYREWRLAVPERLRPGLAMRGRRPHA